MRIISLSAALLLLAACSAPAEKPLSGAWSLDGGASRIAFITVKAGEIAEAHSFHELSGAVAADGSAEVDIALGSVETKIDIRNERMREHLFEVATYPEATIKAKLDPAAYGALKVGESLTQPLAATLSLHGVDSEIDTEVTVTRIAPNKVLVEPTAPIILHADDFNLGVGVEKLRELANLPAITPAVPVTFSFVFVQ